MSRIDITNIYPNATHHNPNATPTPPSQSFGATVPIAETSTVAPKTFLLAPTVVATSLLA